MLPGIGGSELIVIAIVALIVVGPKDLPKLLRQLGKFVGKMRHMADDFRTAFDDMARQSELDELRKEVEALRQNQPLDGLNHQMKAIGSDIETGLNAASSRPAYAQPPVDQPPADSQLTPAADAPAEIDPQLEGLPPKWTPQNLALGEAPPSVMTEVPEVVIKKAPRLRQTASNKPVELTPAEAVTPKTVTPVRKPRARKAAEKTVS